MIQLEVPFNQSINSKQKELIFEFTWRKKTTQNQRNILWSFIFISLALLLISQGNVFGYILIGAVIFYVTNIISVYIYRRKSKKEYYEMWEFLYGKNKQDITHYRFGENQFYYKDAMVEITQDYTTIASCEQIDNTLLFLVNYGIPAYFAINIEEVGEENFYKVKTFLSNKLNGTT
ncbi:hypothetical protein G5B37_09260 [Rasiella rasia]|uniref:YcxB-like protein domain-containing protein n=1 Tax=Rasiella rasia TaxID=2744027 RepID=A0A6G6GPU9_9FLAO|nr:hypothetical protein [Rasiella rasia]QIE59741.1 hypothetical protein G5B37_09260 [Rasiella rasia]